VHVQVIAFLDLNRLEIESMNRDLLAKNLAVRTSLDASVKASKAAVREPRPALCLTYGREDADIYAMCVMSLCIHD
jgi:hypothetical protein